MSKKVIFFVPTLANGGTERVISELSLNLSNVEATIVLFKKIVSYPYKGKIICLDIPIPVKNAFLKFYYFFLSVRRFKRIINRENYDWIISSGTQANLINVLSHKNAVLRIDGVASFETNKFYKWLAKILYKRASSFICVSKFSAQDLIENWGIRKDKIKVIYNPINTEKINKLSAGQLSGEHQNIFQKPTIITVGRLNDQKNQKSLIKALKEVTKKVSDAQLVILGKGEKEAELRKLANDLGIEESVHFLGWQDNPFKFLSKARLFVLSSLCEGLPYAVLEAMACGIPIISADCKSGPREILAPETHFSKHATNIELGNYGILTQPNNDNLLSEAIIKVLTNNEEQKRLSEKSKERASDFDIKKIIDEYKRFI
jgi:glycosyltransferase involved in cell wall biosynthesis